MLFYSVETMKELTDLKHLIKKEMLLLKILSTMELMEVVLLIIIFQEKIMANQFKNEVIPYYLNHLVG